MLEVALAAKRDLDVVLSVRDRRDDVSACPFQSPSTVVIMGRWSVTPPDLRQPRSYLVLVALCDVSEIRASRKDQRPNARTCTCVADVGR